MNQLPPSVLVIFGVTGNLSQRKLLPALYHLQAQNRLPEKFSILAVYRRTPDLGSLFQQTEIQLLRETGKCDPEVLAALRKRTRPLQMDSTDPKDFEKLKAELAGLDTSEQARLNHLFYLAIPPDIFGTVINNLAAAGLNRPEPDRASRILVEKPFGHDLPSAHELIDRIAHCFEEDQVFRIDHYLAKETAQNILTFRFNNPLIEGIWSRDFIDHIQITMAETIGIQGRVAFYEGMGALRDIVQSHLMQLLALVLMERPDGLTSEPIHHEKLKALESIMPIEPEHAAEISIRGQYDGYSAEVDGQSQNETFAAVKLEAGGERWKGVPIFLRTGKALAVTATEIAIIFRDRRRRSIDANLLIIRIQPNEGIYLKLLAKRPGFVDKFEPVNMHFRYHESFNGEHPDAYQRVLLDAIRGDRSLFATSQEVIASWRILQPLLDAWQSGPAQPQPYAKGSWGPASAGELTTRFGCDWVNPQ